MQGDGKQLLQGQHQGGPPIHNARSTHWLQRVQTRRLCCPEGVLPCCGQSGIRAIKKHHNQHAPRRGWTYQYLLSSSKNSTWHGNRVATNSQVKRS